MSRIDELLRKIEKGDPVVILAEENLVERLHELLDYNLVTIKDGKISLTQEGELALICGLPEPIVSRFIEIDNYD